jgi:cytochrome b561
MIGLSRDVSPARMKRPQGYGAATRILHWTTACLIAANVALGLYSATLPRLGEPRETVLYFHKSFGLLVIMITVLRLAWSACFAARIDRSTMAPWERVAARLGHGLLYLALLAMPLSGVLWAEGGGRPVNFFSLFTLPQVLTLEPGLPFRQQPVYRLGQFLHEAVFQWALYAAFALHMAGVIKHRFIDGDRAFVRRMWGLRAMAR